MLGMLARTAGGTVSVVIYLRTQTHTHTKQNSSTDNMWPHFSVAKVAHTAYSHRSRRQKH